MILLPRIIKLAVVLLQHRIVLPLIALSTSRIHINTMAVLILIVPSVLLWGRRVHDWATDTCRDLLVGLRGRVVGGGVVGVVGMVWVVDGYVRVVVARSVLAKHGGAVVASIILALNRGLHIVACRRTRALGALHLLWNLQRPGRMGRSDSALKLGGLRMLFIVGISLRAAERIAATASSDLGRGTAGVAAIIVAAVVVLSNSDGLERKAGRDEGVAFRFLAAC